MNISSFLLPRIDMYRTVLSQPEWIGDVKMLAVTIFGVLVVIIAGVAIILCNKLLHKYANKAVGNVETTVNHAKKKPKKNLMLYVVISYGILIVIVGALIVTNEGRAKQKGNQSVSTAANPTALELSKISNEIASWEVSKREADKITIQAFQKYYTSTSPNTKSNRAHYEYWSAIHTNLLMADQYAKNENFTLLQSSWQAIQQALEEIQGKQEAPMETNFF